MFQILGQGHTRVLTLSQPVQLQRFAADLLQVLRAQRRGRLMAASRLPCAFQDVHQRALEVADYGACTLGDLLSRVPPSVVTVSASLQSCKATVDRCIGGSPGNPILGRGRRKPCTQSPIADYKPAARFFI